MYAELPTQSSHGRDCEVETTLDVAASSTESSSGGKSSTSTSSSSSTSSSISGGVSATARRLQDVLLAWLLLFLAIMSGAAIGPTFVYMAKRNIPEVLAASWRCQVMVLVLLPMAVLEARYWHPPWHWLTLKRKEGLAFPVAAYVFIGGLAWAANLIFWITGLRFTTTVRASIFSGSHPLLLVLYFYLKGDRVTGYEWGGVLLSFTGLLFIAVFSDGLFAAEDAGLTGEEWKGDSLCLVAAVAEVVVLLIRSLTREFVPPLQYTFLTTCVVAFTTTVLAACMALAQGHLWSEVFSTQECGLFGWLTPKWLPTMFVFGFVVGVVCVTGFNFAMQFIAPLVFSCIMLVDPAVTGVISWLMALEGIPDWYTIAGGVVVILGVGLVTVGEDKKRVEEEERAEREREQKEKEKERESGHFEECGGDECKDALSDVHIAVPVLS